MGIDAEDLLTGAPTRLHLRQPSLDRPVSAWSSPWPVRERWWEGVPERFRFQVLLDGGDAWLLFHERGHWFAEGRFD